MKMLRNALVITIAVLISAAFATWLALRAKDNLPAPLAVVDVMDLTIEYNKKIQESNKDNDAKSRAVVEFAMNLSKEVDALAAECHCVLVNKAAVLSRDVPDLTKTLRERLQKL
jgi:hypothetical protein